LRSPLCCHATATTEIYTLSLHDALPISPTRRGWATRFISGCRRRSDGRGRRGAVEKFCFRRPFLLEEWCPARRRQCSSQRRKLRKIFETAGEKPASRGEAVSGRECGRSEGSPPRKTGGMAKDAQESRSCRCGAGFDVCVRGGGLGSGARRGHRFGTDYR